MGTFAETANSTTVYNLPNQGKQTSVFCFPFAENERKFAISVLFTVCVYL